MEASGVRRSWEIEVSSAERSRSVSACSARVVDVARQFSRSIASAAWSDSESSSRRWSGVSSGPGSSRSRPITPTTPRPVRIGRNSRLRARQGVGAAPGGVVVLPGPFGRGEVGLVQHVLRRIAGLHREPVLARQQQHHTHLQHLRDLIGGRPEQIVQRHDAGQLAAEVVELLGGRRPAAARSMACARTRAVEIAGDHRDHANTSSVTTFSGSAMVKV